jgi:cytochrome c biogenesis protein CcmG, thiol:disulfide interchange protein DsbE
MAHHARVGHDAMRQRRALLKTGAGLVVASASGLAALPARANELKLGQPAPPLVLSTLDGRAIATRDLKGQVVIASFWATWCEPFREELPLLSTFAQSHAAQGLQVLGFSLDGPDQLPKVRAVAATLSFPVGLVPSPWAGGYGRIWRLPVSFVTDREGNLAYKGWDEADPVWNKEQLQRVVEPLLARKSRWPMLEAGGLHRSASHLFNAEGRIHCRLETFSHKRKGARRLTSLTTIPD